MATAGTHTSGQSAYITRNWRDLIRPRKLEVETDSLTPTYGKFTCEPLERGFGTTIGNSLRRILLSSLQGSAITAIKIEGALHEFTTIPDVVEDVTDIVLNLKEVLVKSVDAKARVLRLDKDGEGKITAGEAASHPQRMLLLRALTADRGSEPDLQLRQALPGDRYLLCSDGLHAVVEAESIAQVLLTVSDPDRAATDLIALAIDGGGPDNVTCIVADVVTPGIPAAAPRPPGQLAALDRAEQPPREEPLAGQRPALGRTSQQGQVVVSRHRLGAKGAQERAVPLRVDQRAARVGESRGHIRDRDPRRIRTPAEYRIPAERHAHADADGPGDQVAVLQHLDAVGPARLVQAEQASQQRVGEPAGLTARPAFLGDPQE